MCPSSDPEKTTPGMAVAGAGCAALQPGLPTQAGWGAAVDHRLFPVAISSATTPPPALGSGVQSDNGKYTGASVAAPPNSTPPSGPPLPTRDCQTILPLSSGSRP